MSALPVWMLVLCVDAVVVKVSITFLQVFFVIHLHSGPMMNTLPPIMDPDPLLSCDLMDGRDAFLTLARDKHWEFSSLRRCKWSTMCMLVELHNQGQDRFVYTCNECKHHVETRWHCTVCEVRTCESAKSFRERGWSQFGGKGRFVRDLAGISYVSTSAERVISVVFFSSSFFFIGLRLVHQLLQH